MKYFRLKLVVSLVIIMTACKEDKNTLSRTVNIEITSPVYGNEYDKDDTVWMKTFISSNLEISAVNLRVSKEDNDSLVYLKQILPHNTSATISEYFINHMNPHADLLLTVQTTDEDGNETGKKQVQFHCHAH